MGPDRVAVIDDEPSIRSLLEIELGASGFEVRGAADGALGYELVREWSPDLVLLDVMMPRIDGIALLPLLRRVTQAPILILSAKGGTNDRVTGLANGADFYVPKPFEMPHLVSLMRAALRRPALGDPDFMRFHDLTISVRERKVERAGVTLRLTAREFDVLTVLVRQPWRVFSRQDLLEAVWNDRDVSEGLIDTYMSYLRSKVDANFDEPLLHNVRGVGFTVRRGESSTM